MITCFKDVVHVGVLCLNITILKYSVILAGVIIL